MRLQTLLADKDRTIEDLNHRLDDAHSKISVYHQKCSRAKDQCALLHATLGGDLSPTSPDSQSGLPILRDSDVSTSPPIKTERRAEQALDLCTEDSHRSVSQAVDPSYSQIELASSLGKRVRGFDYSQESQGSTLWRHISAGAPNPSRGPRW